ncbi:MAG: phosphotransferase family protein [Acidimicrobiia bacterium]
MADDALRARFAEWLAARVGAPVQLGAFSTPGHGGFSNETILTTAEWNGKDTGLVLRLAPAGTGLFPDYDLDRQSRVLEALRAHTDVPVPEVLWREADPNALGRPFYVMARVDGRIPPDRPGYQFLGWVKDAPADEQALVLDAGLDAIARIHHVEPDAAGLGFLDRAEHGRGAIEQELGYWRAYLDWASDGARYDLLEQIYDWCSEHRPSEPARRGLVWGDARLGNLIYAESPLPSGGLPVLAVMDWEMALLGPPELDLGWFLFLERLALQFTEGLPGFLAPDGMVAAYERKLGRPVEHLDWYETWGGFRAACIHIPLVTIAHAQGEAPDLAGRERNPLTAELLQRIR